MSQTASLPDILCIGAVLWDIVGRSPHRMALGHDVPGTVARLPGGVALNVAMACRREGMRPGLLSHVGTDCAGHDLARDCDAMGLDTRYLTRSDTLPTDAYMAIEAANGLIAAVADAHALERAGAAILDPLRDGRLGSAARPWPGLIALDGNLTEDLLARIAISPLFGAADLRLAPASPGKALRLLPLLTHPRATLYLNRIEAGILCDTRFEDAAAAARALLRRGAGRVIVTDGAAPVAEGGPAGLREAVPPPVQLRRITGAGDTFMAAHIAAGTRGLCGSAALHHALAATACYISKG